jgi:propanol-preferring alcohol dehydrogenase
MKAAVLERRGDPLVVKQIDDPSRVQADEVVVKVAAAGICHSDLHLQDGLFSDLGIDVFPVVPGHETAGVVEETGAEVTHLKTGDRVGVYWIYPCGRCPYCLAGEEQACTAYLPTLDANGFGRQGGFANYIKVPASHALALPPELPFEAAAPLFCGGMTVYGGLKKANLRPGQRVAILGIGGLGHLAIQIASAMGADVIAATSTPAKADAAMSFGARHVVVGSEDTGKQLQALGGVDVVLSCTLDPHGIAGVMDGLNPLGTLVLTGFTGESLSIVPMALAIAQHKVIGSLIASRRDTAELLQLAAQNGIGAVTETFRLNDVNDAFARLRRGDVRYRAVLVPA